MTPREQAAYDAGIEAAQQMAMVAAVTMEATHDAGTIRKLAAVAALQALSEGLSDLFLVRKPEPKPDAIMEAVALSAAQPGTHGVIVCPECSGRLQWGRDSLNGHLHGECETEGCLRWME